MTQEIPVTAQTSDLQITLKEDSQSLDEVVVVGYGVQKKKLVTGATVEVKGDEVAKRNTISPLSALQNQSPGVNIVASSGQPGDGFKVNIRGAGTNGDTAPIYVIEGRYAGVEVDLVLNGHVFFGSKHIRHLYYILPTDVAVIGYLHFSFFTLFCGNQDNTIRLNSEHILWKNKDQDIIKFGENVYYQHTSNQGIQIGNQYSNSIYSMMGANPLVPLYNSQGELFDYDDLIAQGSGSMGLLGLNQYINNPMNTLLNTTSGNNKIRNHNLSAIGYIEIQPLKDMLGI